MLSERDIKVLKVMIPNLSFMITKMVSKNIDDNLIFQFSIYL